MHSAFWQINQMSHTVFHMWFSCLLWNAELIPKYMLSVLSLWLWPGTSGAPRLLTQYNQASVRSKFQGCHSTEGHVSIVIFWFTAWQEKCSWNKNCFYRVVYSKEPRNMYNKHSKISLLTIFSWDNRQNFYDHFPFLDRLQKQSNSLILVLFWTTLTSSNILWSSDCYLLFN